MRIGDQMVHTKGRVLPNPEIQFGNQKHNPGISGRWDLRGKKFFKPNRVPLKSWGCGIIVYRRNTLEMTQAENWCNAFMKQYAGHGGKVESKPYIMVLNNDIAESITTLYENTGNKFKQRPQLLIFFAPNKDSWPYLRIKKSCDCRYGVASQVLQSQQVVKMNTQYMSNVAMKINAKLGGVTARAIPRHPDAALRPGSMIIGADVSHATPGSWAPSSRLFVMNGQRLLEKVVVPSISITSATVFQLASFLRFLTAKYQSSRRQSCRAVVRRRNRRFVW
jgi:eukaryotic translation initiation factor 2C